MGEIKLLNQNIVEIWLENDLMMLYIILISGNCNISETNMLGVK